MADLWQKYHPVATGVGNALSQYKTFLKDHWSTILKDPAQGFYNALSNTYSAVPSDRGINALNQYLQTGEVPEDLPQVDMNQLGGETFDMVFPIAGTIAGIGAKTANKAAVEMAQAMKKAGTTDDEIFRRTADEFGQGWWLGHPDTKPRFEIDDSAARYRSYQYTPKEAYNAAAQNAMIDGQGFDRIKKMAPYKDMSLAELKAEYKRTGGEIVKAAQSGDIELAKKLSRDRSGLDGLMGEMSRRPYGPMSNYMSHGELGQSYPDVYKIHTRIDPDLDAKGIYNQGRQGIQGEMISLKSPPQDVIGNTTPYHETQHAIQQREGFARGGSPSGPYQHGERDRLIVEKFNQLKKIPANAGDSDQAIWDHATRLVDHQDYKNELYKRLGGESEARLTQARMDMTAAERAAPGNEFYKHYDVPLNEMILRYDGGPNAMASLPMDEASRMQRAKDQGYKIDAYHGTSQDIDEFNLGFSGKSGLPRTGKSKLIWSTSNPMDASEYAKSASSYKPRGFHDVLKNETPVAANQYAQRNQGKGANVMPLKLKAENPLVIDGKGRPSTYRQQAKNFMRSDHDLLIIENANTGDGTIRTIYATKDPKNIRSRFAAFDPAKKDSANILSGAAGAGVALHWSDILNGENNALQAQ